MEKAIKEMRNAEATRIMMYLGASSEMLGDHKLNGTT